MNPSKVRVTVPWVMRLFDGPLWSLNYVLGIKRLTSVLLIGDDPRKRTTLWEDHSPSKIPFFYTAVHFPPDIFFFFKVMSCFLQTLWYILIYLAFLSIYLICILHIV